MRRRAVVGIVAGLVVAAGVVAAGSYALVTNYYGGVGFASLDGTGSAVSPLASPTQLTQGTYGLGIGDFDNDGVDDYVVGGIGPSGLATIELHHGNGDGTYAPGTTIAGAGGWYYYVMDFAVADYDGDGNLDFAVNDYNERGIHLYRGLGNGTFAALGTYTLPFLGNGVDAADINGDGYTDFVVARAFEGSFDNNCSTVTYFCGYYYWDGYYYAQYCSYQSCPSDVAAVEVFLNDGHGGFSQTYQAMSFSFVTPNGNNARTYDWGITAADFDGDGKVDVAMNETRPDLQGGNTLLVFRGNGNGTFQNEPIRTGPVLSGQSYSEAALDNDDVNHDGIQDIVVGEDTDQSVRVYLGRGDGTFTLSTVDHWSGTFLTDVSTHANGALDRTPPSVAIQPLPALTNNPTVTIQGSATDAGGIASVEVLDQGNVIATVTPGAGGAVSVAVTLADGPHAIALRATDRAHNQATSSTDAVNVDTHAPQVAINALPQYATEASFAVTGAALDDNSGIASVSVTVNGVAFAASIDLTGAVVANVTLTPGTNALAIVATDAAGNHSTATGSVIFDDVGPAVALNALPDFTNQPAQTISGTASDTYGIATLQLIVDGAQVGAPFTPASDGTFSIPAVLVEGANTVAVKATNVAGLTGSAQVASLLDTVAPTATLASLPAYTNQPSLAAAGTTADIGSGVASATFRAGAASVTSPIAPDGSVAATLPLAEGVQTILLEVRDRAGNVGSTTVDITLDTVPPVLAIVSPTDGQPFGATTVGVTTSVTDSSPTTVSFGTYAFNVAAGGGTSSGSVELPGEGYATIPVTARDAAGNVTTASVKVVVDLTAPVADVDVVDGIQLGPQPGNQLPFNLHVDDLTQVTVGESWDASFAHTFDAGGGVLTGLLPLTEGHDAFVVTLTDAVGHVTVVSRTLTYDVTPPTAAFTGVLASAGTPVRGAIELAATATDNLTGVASAQFTVDGAPATTTAASGAFSASFDTTALADGVHSVTATFSDGVGNATSLTSTILVDNTPPAVAIASPSANSYLRQTITVTAGADDATSGVAAIDVSVNGAPLGSCTSSPCTLSLDTTALANGPFVVAASARDRAGNTAAAPQVTAIADNTAPSKFLVSPVTGATAGASVTLQVNVIDDYFAQVECFEDGVSLGVSTSPQLAKTISLLDKLDGPVTFTCSARDLAGNVGTESATVTVKNWLLQLDPRTLNLRSNGSDVQLEIDGANVSLLLPVTGKGLAIAVPGGSPVPVAAKPGGYQLGTVTIGGVTESSLALKFDRTALNAAIKAGLASGAIKDPSAVTVRFLAGSRELGHDTIRVQP